MTRLRGRAAIAIGAAFVVAAIVLSVLQPSDEFQLSPYTSAIDTLDTPYDAREFTLAVSAVGLADRLQVDDRRMETPGVWLIVDADFTRRLDRGGISPLLTIGRTTYAVSERVGTSGLDSETGQPGLPVTGSIAFELPESALAASGADHAVLRFSSTSDAALDSALELVIDLGTLDRVADATMLDAGRVTG